MPNLVQTSPQPKVIFNFQGPSGASPGIAGAVQFTPENLGNGQGHKSDVYDLGPGVRNNLFQWRAKATVRSGLPAIGTTVEIYFCTSEDNVNWDAALGSGILTSTNMEKRRNLHHLGSISVDQNASGVPFCTSGFAMCHARYLAVVWWNYTGFPLSTITGENYFELVPVPDHIEQF